MATQHKSGVVRAAAILVILIASVAILFYARQILIPLAYGAVLAMLMDPVSEWLQRKGLPRWLSLTLSVILLLLVISGFVAALSAQVAAFISDIPQIQQSLSKRLADVQVWTSENTPFDLGPTIQEFKGGSSSMLQQASFVLRELLTSITNILSNILLVIVYVIFMLIDKKRFYGFVKQYTPETFHSTADQVVGKIGRVAGGYVWGKVIITISLAIGYSIGFLLIGLKYAIFLGIVAALFTIIPYIGNIIGGAIVVLIAFISSPGLTLVLLALAIISVVQLLENYVLTPLVFGYQINLNPFITIFGVIAFGYLWGISGLVLALPLIGIFKVICDHIPALKPIGYLLGDNDHLEE